jgi:hypothetical protein
LGEVQLSRCLPHAASMHDGDEDAQVVHLDPVAEVIGQVHGCLIWNSYDFMQQ